MRDMRKWMNADFISALDLIRDDGSGYKTLDVVIDKILDPAPVQCGPKREVLAVARFKTARKGMILRDSHMKNLIKLLGPDADKMAGKTVRLWVETDVKAFGDIFDCVRFKAVTGNGRSLMPTWRNPDDDPDEALSPDDESAQIQRVLEDRSAQEDNDAELARQQFTGKDQMEIAR